MTTAGTNLSAVSGLDMDDFDGGSGSAIAITGDAAGSDQSTLAGGYDNTDFQVIAAAGTLTLTVAAPLTDGTNNGAVGRSEATAANLAAQTGFMEGDSVAVSIGNVTASYMVRVNDQESDIAAGLRAALNDAGLSSDDYLLEAGGAALTVVNNTGTEVRIDVSATRGGGGLSGLAGINVSDAAGAATALGTIEHAISVATSAQADLGTTTKRLEIQSDFMSKQIDSFKSGIGSIVDADMEEASARLQALQVQQQLAVQALSIANQAPQSILSLFR